jgi:hypothetical protein
MTHSLLLSVVTILEKAINMKLMNADHITSNCLLLFIEPNDYFIGLAATLAYNECDKETLVIGIERMTGRHTA